MDLNLIKKMVTAPLKEAGITLNGPNPYDIQVHNERIYRRVFFDGSRGFGNGYMDGDWDCEDIPEFIRRICVSGADANYKHGFGRIALNIMQWLTDQQSRLRSLRVGKEHYDFSPEAFKLILGTDLVYTSAKWEGAATLKEAQANKLETVCRKINLLPGQRVLDIGCGWGSFMKYAAENYGAHVIGVTISEEQAAYVRTHCGPHSEVRLQDYRDVEGTFDHVVSIEMFEQVGRRHLPEFMGKTRSLVKKPSGNVCIQGIVGNKPGTEPWLNEHIFPGGYMPSLAEVTKAAEGLFVVEHAENIGADYAPTLRAWDENLTRNFPEIQRIGPQFDDRWFRMMHYYFTLCEGTFRARVNQDYQFVLSPHGTPGGWKMAPPRTSSYMR